ncbi:hypothetical protein VNO78_11807 [Psophocarpus tetragonolobus]|uniref:Dof zinc finger protein n=1 Tax=Psophocarpus tetragonolobus TaxID=3891 RepID=A0AAN9XPC3_PSOTE
MEQEGERREENRQAQRAAPQQQKCPRCDSTNTKFCYFNNYSLSQPRHFCKTCKRYWTHGGTFRNIPVGGGSRKGKRARTNISSPSSNLLTQPTLLRPNPPLVTNMVQSYNYQLDGVGVSGSGSGYLSSLARLQSLNNTSQPFNQYHKVGGDVTASASASASSNSPLVSAFNTASFPPNRFHHRDRVDLDSIYATPQRLIPSNIGNGNIVSLSAQRPQSLITNVSSANHRASSDASVWSATVNATSIAKSDQNNVRAASSSFIPNHWLHLPGYGAPQ